jgi:ubiquinone/menaquinone biosynthesis C-methylase UbiE
MTGAPGGEQAAGQLVASMWWYAATVLEPARALKRRGVRVTGTVMGDELAPTPSPGLGPRFSVEWSSPALLGHPTAHDHLVADFDQMAHVYDAYVRPFSTPIFAEAVVALEALITPDARLLDAGCGAGRELREMARLVPLGEVVGVDLAAGMVREAWAGARAGGLDNTAFAQADIGALPEVFDGAFDLAYCCLAHHHYPDPPAAARAVCRALRPGGLYAVIDPGPAWFNTLSAPLARWADPGWIGFHTPEQFRDLMLAAGFVRFRWDELLPGFGLALAQKET